VCWLVGEWGPTVRLLGSWGEVEREGKSLRRISSVETTLEADLSQVPGTRSGVSIAGEGWRN
jgi:hypothetical protein